MSQSDRSRSDTPPVPAPRRSSPVRLLLTIAITGAGGWFVGHLAGEAARGAGADVLGGARPSGAVVASVLVAAMGLVLLVHELGHLLAGLVQGNQFMLLAVGPVLLRREEGQVRLRFNRSLALWGGVAATLPRSTSLEAMRANLFRVVLWGPLASLLLTLLAALLLPVTGGAARLLCLVVAVASFAILLATTVPPRTGAFYTDGARLRMLRAGGDDAARWCLVTVLAAMSAEGQPPEVWPAELVTRAEALADASSDGMMLHLVLYEHGVAAGDDARAGAHMAALRAMAPTQPPLLRSMLLLESAYWAAVGEREASVARAALDAATTNPFESKVARLRTEGAVLLAEGRHEEGAARLREADRQAAASTDGAMRNERTRIARARALTRSAS